MNDDLFFNIENFLNQLRQEDKSDYTMDATINITLRYKGMPIEQMSKQLSDEVDPTSEESIRAFVHKLFTQR